MQGTCHAGSSLAAAVTLETCVYTKFVVESLFTDKCAVDNSGPCNIPFVCAPQEFMIKSGKLSSPSKVLQSKLALLLLDTCL